MILFARKVQFYGRVQGINFRRNVMRKAMELGVRGWVANQPDGSVSAVFQGNEQDVTKLIRFCLTGIPLARIDRHRVEDSAEDEYESFRIL